MVKKIINAAGINKTVLFILMNRVWTVLGGIGSIYFLTKYLTPEVQGYYYTFSSLITLQLFIELGLTNAIMHFVSHEMASLSWKPEGVLTGDAHAKKRMKSILNFATLWFGVGSVLLITLLLPVGVFLLKKGISASAVENLDIIEPWTILVCATAVNMIITGGMSILEGTGEVQEISKIRIYKSMFSTLTVWIVLVLGGNLYALAISSMVMGLISVVFLLNKYHNFFIDIFRFKSSLPGISWRNEIWPFQWRIAVSWASGFLTFSLFNPILLIYHGPVAAGKMGMSLQIIMALNNAAMSWIDSKVPTFGGLIALKKIGELNKHFFKALRQSFAFLLLTIVFLLLLLSYLSATGSQYAERVIPLPYFCLLTIICLANHIVFSEASYLRAYKGEPFMIVSLINGITTAILASTLIPNLGTAGAVFSYAFGAILVSLGAGSVIFYNKYKKELE